MRRQRPWALSDTLSAHSASCLGHGELCIEDRQTNGDWITIGWDRYLARDEIDDDARVRCLLAERWSK